MSRDFGFFLAATVGFASLMQGACAWDWTVRSAEENDAGSPGDVAGDGASAADTGASDSATASDASECSALLAAVASEKSQAITCTLGSVPDCSTSVADECGCGVFVGQSGSTATQHFATAVDSAKAAGCTTQCTGCTALPVRGTCVENGASFMCSPP